MTCPVIAYGVRLSGDDGKIAAISTDVKQKRREYSASAIYVLEPRWYRLFMIMGHAALVVLGKRTILSLAPIPLMILAVYGPDVIDKSAALVLGTPGKWAGHSLLIFAIVTLALLFIPARRLAPAWWVLSLFWLSHLFLDITDPVVLLWPLLGEFPPGPP